MTSGWRSGLCGGDILQATIARLDAPGPDHHDLNHHQADHQPHHTGQLIARHQRADDERRDHRRAAAERIADAVGAQPDLGREQFRRVDAEQDRGLHINRDDQHEADAQHDRWIGRRVEACIDVAEHDGGYRSANDAPAPPDCIGQIGPERAAEQRGDRQYQRIAERVCDGEALPQEELRQGLTITNSLGYTLVLSIASLLGCALGAYLSDAIGRRWSIISASIATIVFGYIYARFNAASDPTIVLSVGFVLIVAIYVQTAILFGVYTPELFPTEIRLRANGICNTFGRGATVISPFIVGALMASYQLPGVVWLMISLVVIQIVVVWAWGVEPRNRALEDVAAAKA